MKLGSKKNVKVKYESFSDETLNFFIRKFWASYTFCILPKLF